MKRFLGVLLVLVLVVSLATIGLPSPVQAATFTVNSIADTTDANPGNGTCDDGTGKCTLRAAIQETNALAGPDTINLPSGNYTLSIAGTGEDAAATGDLDITDNLTLTGAGQATTIIDGGAIDRVIEVHSGSNVEISGVTLQNGYAVDRGAGLSNWEATLTLTNVTVRDNTTEAGPWGRAEGGGISNWGTATLTNCTVSNNTVIKGVAIGGGIFTARTMTLSNCTINGNTARDGGGIYQFSHTITLNSCNISGNSASDGGGLYGAGWTIILSDCNVIGNTASRGGGGIFSWGGVSIQVINSNIIDNVASGDGGGISHKSGIVTLTNSTISGNTALGDGGGINVYYRTAELTNSTISNNIASNRGGGIFNCEGTANLTNVTIYDNTATEGGGIHASPFADTYAKNTIIAKNLSCDCWLARITSLGHNLDSDNTCGLSGPGDISGVDPLLGPLQDNGGPTFTHALLSGSPAIDAGDNTDCPATDQRGVARPLDGDGDSDAICDIGAYEYVPPLPPPVEVGGEAYPVNKLAFVAPWLALAIAIMAGATLAVRYRRARN